MRVKLVYSIIIHSDTSLSLAQRFNSHFVSARFRVPTRLSPPAPAMSNFF